MRPPTLVVNDLPAEIPLFPLSGVVLVPGARLPLYIFEPRYLNMFADAASNNRFVGIVQPRRSHPDPVPEDAPIYQVGGLGYLVDETPDADGPSDHQSPHMISLEGVARFALIGEIDPLGGYRRGRVDYAPFRDDLSPSTRSVDDRPRLLEAVEGFLTRGGLGPDIPPENVAQICQGPTDMLVAALITLCPFQAVEKQALLESPTLATQGAMLTNLLEMAIFEHDAVGDGGGSEHQH